MITIDATGSTSGIDFEAYIRGGFLTGTGNTNPTFNDSPYSGTEALYSYVGGKYVLATGSFSYDIGTHVVSGYISGIEFGTGSSAALTIAGLNLLDPGYTAFLGAYREGGNANPIDLATFANALDVGPQHFKGSAHGDVFTGTTFAELIEGNGGDDRLGGGGGSDDIDGGAGTDTAIFADPESSYTVVRYDTGLITVTKGTEITTLKNVEKLEFDGGSTSVDTGGLTPVAVARATIDASAMNGVNFDTYLADYFAQVKLNGTSGYHGGTLDFYYGNYYYLNGDQVSFKYSSVGDPSGPKTFVVLLEGEEIALDTAHHGVTTGGMGSVSGAVDKIIFASIAGAEPNSGPDLYTDYAAQIVISGLGIYDAPGAGGSSSANDVPSLYYGINTGNVAKIEAVLAKYAFDFIGSNGDDTFTGGIFDDVIDGGHGIDTLKGDRGDDTITGGFDDDVLSGGFGNDTLFGNGGIDTLSGDEGDDVLIGGKHGDELSGGSGADVFMFLRQADSRAKKGGFDAIHDFSQDDGDLIDLSGFKKKLDFIGKDAFSKDGDAELRYSYKDKVATIVKADFDGDGKTDFKIKLDGKIALAEADFVL